MSEYKDVDDKDEFDHNGQPIGGDGPIGEGVAGVAALIVMIGSVWFFFEFLSHLGRM